MTAIIVLAVIGLVVYSIIINGLVLSALWEWFIVGTFGLPSISIPVAIGIALIMVMLSHRPNDKSNKKASEQVAIALIHPFIILGIGFIVKQFI